MLKRKMHKRRLSRRKDFGGEDKSMRLSVEGNTIEKMIVEVGQKSRGKYFCEKEAR